MGSYKCAEDKLESTLDLALLAFQAHPPALIVANKGVRLARCCTLGNWELLPLKVTFFQCRCSGQAEAVPVGKAACQLQGWCCFSGKSQPICFHLCWVFTCVLHVEGDKKSLWRTCHNKSWFMEELPSDNKR